MPKVFTSKSQRTGELGEHLASRYLETKGFSIFERNYTKKWGEIDIVAVKDGTVHFVEVKTKSVLDCKAVLKNDYRPEDGMHRFKIERLKRTITTYLLDRAVAGKWQFDLALVYMSDTQKRARIELVEDLIL